MVGWFDDLVVDRCTLLPLSSYACRCSGDVECGVLVAHATWSSSLCIKVGCQITVDAVTSPITRRS